MCGNVINIQTPSVERIYVIHHNDIIMGAMASQITGVGIVYSTVCSDADQRKHQGSASLAFVRGIHRWPVNSPHKGPVMRKMFPFDDVIMLQEISLLTTYIPVWHNVRLVQTNSQLQGNTTVSARWTSLTSVHSTRLYHFCVSNLTNLFMNYAIYIYIYIYIYLKTVARTDNNHLLVTEFHSNTF